MLCHKSYMLGYLVYLINSILLPKIEYLHKMTHFTDNKLNDLIKLFKKNNKTANFRFYTHWIPTSDLTSNLNHRAFIICNGCNLGIKKPNRLLISMETNCIIRSLLEYLKCIDHVKLIKDNNNNTIHAVLPINK